MSAPACGDGHIIYLGQAIQFNVSTTPTALAALTAANQAAGPAAAASFLILGSAGLNVAPSTKPPASNGSRLGGIACKLVVSNGLAAGLRDLHGVFRSVRGRLGLVWSALARQAVASTMFAAGTSAQAGTKPALSSWAWQAVAMKMAAASVKAGRGMCSRFMGKNWRRKCCVSGKTD